MLAEEALRDKAEAVLKKMEELEKEMAEGNASPEQEIQDTGQPTVE